MLSKFIVPARSQLFLVPCCKMSRAAASHFPLKSAIMPEKPKVVVTAGGIDVSKLQEVTSIYQNPNEGPLPRDVLLKEIKDAEGIICTLLDKIDQEFFDNAKHLKVVSTISVGLDHVNLDACRRLNLIVGNTPDVLTRAVAELAVALILIANRQLFANAKKLQDGAVKEWAPFYLCGNGIEGQTIGIFGLGRIGEDIARKLRAFDPKEIIYHNRSPKTLSEPYTYVSFEELLSRSDTLIISAAVDSLPTGMFNLDIFKKMKSTAVLINISRGKVVNHDDLVTALREGVISGAGLDVTDPEPLPASHPLLALENCVVLPHIASATFSTRQKMVSIAVDNLYNGLRGGNVIGPKWKVDS